DVLAVAIYPCSDEAEAVEVSASLLVALLQFEGDGLAVQRQRDATLAAGRRGRVGQRPVVDLAVGVDVGRLPVEGMALFGPAEAIHRRKVKAFAARSVRGDAQKVARQTGVLRRIDSHAVSGMEEAEKDCAIGDAAPQADLAGRSQRLRHGQRT